MSRKLKLVTDELFREMFSNLNDVLKVLSERLSSKLAQCLVVTTDENEQIYRFSLMSHNGEILSSTTINLPIESMLVDVKLDETKQNLIFTLKNGVKTLVPITSIVDGLATTEQINNEAKLRKTEDEKLERKITDESLARVSGILELRKSINAEAAERKETINETKKELLQEINKNKELLTRFFSILGVEGGAQNA